MHSRYWAMMQSNDTKWVLLGDYISACDERNTDKRYGIDSVMGVSIAKKFISTKADMTGVSLSPYKLVKPNEFCFVTITSRNGGKISLALNDSADVYIVSSSYEVFKIDDENVLCPEYLFLWFNQPEFDRYARFHSWGSAREAFSYDDMCRVRIPLPSIEKQRELVATWKGLRDMKEQNEAMAAPLMQLCQSRLQELKHKYPLTEIGPYIEQCDERNSENVYGIDSVMGVSIAKKFIPTKADMGGVSLTPYKLVRPNEFCYVTVTSRNGGKISLALNQSEDTYIVSSSYEVFKVIDDTKLCPGFLYLWFCQSEFDRYARFHSWGSARETFSYESMERVGVPLPSIEEQQAIVNIYKCAAECKRIAEEADRLSREICPALMQKAIRG